MILGRDIPFMYRNHKHTLLLLPQLQSKQSHKLPHKRKNPKQFSLLSATYCIVVVLVNVTSSPLVLVMLHKRSLTRPCYHAPHSQAHMCTTRIPFVFLFLVLVMLHGRSLVFSIKQGQLAMCLIHNHIQHVLLEFHACLNK